jgi:tRNA A-37 threonylcarbamoyl transferase component Bud32
VSDSGKTGRFEVLRPLATGGMGELYLARARGIEGFERLVVLKRLKADAADNEQSIKSFLDEVRVLASVQHSNIVHIYDVGTSKDGGYYYTMEFLVGQDLRKLLIRSRQQQRPLPLANAVYIASHVLAGLHHVHDRKASDGSPLNIIHRDVSPANIFLTYEGDVKLIDFGIAKTAKQTTQTENGVVKGKFRYMSPEQCRTDPLDRRSDVFALGVVLWEATTGRSLYKADDDIKTLFSIVERDAPAPSTVVADYPPGLEAIVMKALSRDPDTRWQTAREMQAALETFALDMHWPQTASSLSALMHARFPTEVAAIEGAQGSGANIAELIAQQLEDSGDASAGTPSSASLPNIALRMRAEGKISGRVSMPPALTGVTPSVAPPAYEVEISIADDGPPRRNKLVFVAAGAAVLLVVAGAVALGGSSNKGVAPAPAPAVPVVTAPEPLVVKPPPVAAPPEPPVAVAPEPVREKPDEKKPAPPPKAVAKPAVRKPSPAKPANWDPDSPLPPPE